MMAHYIAIPICIGLALGIALFVLFEKHRKLINAFGSLQASSLAKVETLEATLTKYEPIMSIEIEAARVTAELKQLESERDKFIAEDASRRGELNEKYLVVKRIYDRLSSDVALLEENLEDISFGVYKPHFTFDTSEEFKRELEDVWAKKKTLIRDGKASLCHVKWAVADSKRDGERMTKQITKAMMRAFNGECDAAVAKATWNNITSMEMRIRKSFEAINELGTVMKIEITNEYFALCLSELNLTHEYEMKKHAEQEEQRHIREEMREEEKARREYERAQQEATDDEAKFQKALERARSEVAKAQGEEIQAINAKVRELENKLAEAVAMKERAIALAQLTKTGNIYVISNIGSFGEDVFKIGMTRRLDPMDRVRELGDASVPFSFDVHAIIYSENAPELEAAFHQEFSDRRLNLVNMRKEYFRVGLLEIEAFAQSRGVAVQFTRLAEAQQFRQSLAMRTKSNTIGPAVNSEKAVFPDRLPEV